MVVLKLHVCMTKSRGSSLRKVYLIRRILLALQLMVQVSWWGSTIPSKLLKDDIPDLFVLRCTCHSFHLCASYACNKLPRSTEDLARDIYHYFQSPKQSSSLKEFQEFTNVKPHKMLHPSQTRWLSLHGVVKRLLEQLPALKLFFTIAVLENRLLSAESISSKT